MRPGWFVFTVRIFFYSLPTAFIYSHLSPRTFHLLPRPSYLILSSFPSYLWHLTSYGHVSYLVGARQRLGQTKFIGVGPPAARVFSSTHALVHPDLFFAAQLAFLSHLFVTLLRRAWRPPANCGLTRRRSRPRAGAPPAAGPGSRVRLARASPFEAAAVAPSGHPASGSCATTKGVSGGRRSPSSRGGAASRPATAGPTPSRRRSASFCRS